VNHGKRTNRAAPSFVAEPHGSNSEEHEHKIQVRSRDAKGRSLRKSNSVPVSEVKI
jgi:hypothetical protein